MPAPTSSHRSATQATEIDIATNEALLQHAEASRLAKSWLNSALGDNDNSTSNGREDEQEEFEPNLAKNAALYSENGGIGYTQPIDSSSARASDPATAFLRKQLLGRGGQRGNLHHNQHTTSKSRPGPATSSAHRRGDSDDEEEGRSGLGKSKTSKTKNTPGTLPNISRTYPDDTDVGTTNAASNNSVQHAASGQGPPHVSKTTKKRGSSYLDEILASRAAKKKKKSGKGSNDDG
ncbi:hypothetical protein H2202_002315 [Exophiala xenobiotica]|nr:hypothetical protein H2202_002315 [Exophiala xenobiotica]KAK5208579.1 hypothetical protein LTR41_005806 [Exophiala xenobiotica]KAK5229959.1 hypothetical protein LTR72_001493 [Exophiala xenobiotica]KAK5234798.1 hypothetical protein LTR47_004243 [Exophiala xenobiotica]KAK5247917.1 hypothetical protein LTS06_007013 [Exophiala xenobiotica]